VPAGPPERHETPDPKALQRSETPDPVRPAGVRHQADRHDQLKLTGTTVLVVLI
jgi:hypothetical protein